MEQTGILEIIAGFIGDVSKGNLTIIMFGGSPHIVAEPPRFAQKISERIIGIVSHAQTGLTVAFIGTVIAIITLITSGKYALEIIKKADKSHHTGVGNKIAERISQ